MPFSQRPSARAIQDHGDHFDRRAHTERLRQEHSRVCDEASVDIGFSKGAEPVVRRISAGLLIRCGQYGHSADGRRPDMVIPGVVCQSKCQLLPSGTCETAGFSGRPVRQIACRTSRALLAGWSFHRPCLDSPSYFVVDNCGPLSDGAVGHLPGFECGYLGTVHVHPVWVAH